MRCSVAVAARPRPASDRQELLPKKYLQTSLGGRMVRAAELERTGRLPSQPSSKADGGAVPPMGVSTPAKSLGGRAHAPRADREYGRRPSGRAAPPRRAAAVGPGGGSSTDAVGGAVTCAVIHPLAGSVAGFVANGGPPAVARQARQSLDRRRPRIGRPRRAAAGGFPIDPAASPLVHEVSIAGPAASPPVHEVAITTSHVENATSCAGNRRGQAESAQSSATRSTASRTAC